MAEYKITLPYKVKSVSNEDNKGVFVIEGLYPGYGHTLGNSLRRVILSSLTGASLTSIKIDGVSHEFQTIEGVKEDVIVIILNLKKIRFKLLSDEPQIVNLSINGPKTVTAADIKTSAQVEVLNPDLYLMEINKKANINIEMRIENGLGFVPKEVLQKEKVSVGTIIVDAIFTPIRRVSYEVENMRVGDNTDYNRLIIAIETDGTLTAREAFEKSIKIMINQLRAIINLSELEESEKEKIELEKQEKEASNKKDKNESKIEGITKKDDKDWEYTLKTKIEDVEEFSTRTINVLTKTNIKNLGDLAKKQKEDLLEIEGLGAKCISEIENILEKLNILNVKL